ncbi:alpha-L-fucosidase [Murimonas intestini]|uniref:alpha-L-fucosidase n=1 Tax=Murimonas intestini TaxID=1337051 RepID=UPI0011DD36C9|nr:alpha-L-fucosidase [Murimonas intestini]
MSDNWFLEAKYGMFIHFGLYSLMGGVYKGEEIPYGAEWIMKNAQIPLDEYRQLMERFDPGEFNAADTVALARKSGMKYLVFTAKHHDGFSMYDTRVSDYNIMNTPFGRDIVKELMEECERQGIVFCLYYSQMQDWEDENGWGNEWDFRKNEEKDFRKYFNEKVKPQVKELLTNYGKIGIIWFDTPYVMPIELCRELRDWVKKWQPECLINGRIGYGLGDYRQMSDNQMPVLTYHGPWETPVTLNDTWGYSSEDEDWKSPEEVLERLLDAAGKGGNLLLNVGPDGEGRIPPGSCEVLQRVGEWLEKNGESIYGTLPMPDTTYQIRWGKLTAGQGRLYLHVLEYPRFPYEILIVGLETAVKRVFLLENGRELTFYQSYEPARDEYRFRVLLPEERSEDLAVTVCAELDGELKFQKLC